MLDIASGAESDCNENQVPDSCDLIAGETDCNLNDLLDSCDIAANPFLDFDDDGIIDTCAACAGDANLDGSVNVTDLLQLLAAWGGCPLECTNRNHRAECPPDFTGDCQVDVTDLLDLLSGWGSCF